MPWHTEIRFYHAGLSREERTETERWFLNNSEAVLAATCAYGLGIDKADIRTIIHRDCPPSVEAYLQESGRAGRDGQPSAAVLLWGPEDERHLARAQGEAAKQRLTKLLDYARDTRRCRRQALLRLLDYDGETDSPAQHCCDVCEKQAKTDLREERSLLDFFRRNKRRYTTAEAARFLAGAQNLCWTEEAAEQAINYLVKTGSLKRLKNPLWKHKLTCITNSRRNP
jgi:ATP-dependent DNA helicase RecQ